MSFRLAVAGKGGTGKTTVAGLVIRALVDRQAGAVLAVDADPNSSLGLWLGMEAETTLADVREQGNKIGRSETTGMSKHAAIEYALQTAVTEGDGVDLAAMGRPEGPGCYCYVNNMLRGFLEKLSGSYAWVVMDNEAGMEHLSRRTTSNIDLLAIVYEPTVIGVTTAKRLMDLSGNLPVTIRRKMFVMNRAPADGLPPKVAERVAAAGVEPEVCVPVDAELYELSAGGESIFKASADSPALAAARELLDRWQSGEKDSHREENSG